MTKTFADLKAWILAQPDDRPVDMGSAIAVHGRCGCLLIEYARDLGIGSENDMEAGMVSVYDGTERVLDIKADGMQWGLIDIAIIRKAKSFADAKRILAEMEAP